MSIGAAQTVEAQRHRRVDPVPTAGIEHTKNVMKSGVRFPKTLSVWVLTWIDRAPAMA